MAVGQQRPRSCSCRLENHDAGQRYAPDGKYIPYTFLSKADGTLDDSIRVVEVLVLVARRTSRIPPVCWRDGGSRRLHLDN